MNLSVNDQQFQLRLMGAVLAFALGTEMFKGALWILSEQSVTWRVAQLSTYPHALAGVWMVLAVQVIPYFCLQAFDWFAAYRAGITRLACRSVLAGGVIWIYLGWLSKNLDYKYTTIIFVFTGLISVAMSAVLANGLNSSQRHELDGAA